MKINRWIRYYSVWSFQTEQENTTTMNCIHCRISRVQVSLLVLFKISQKVSNIGRKCVQSSKPNICERCLKHGRKPEECAVKATMYELLETYSVRDVPVLVTTQYTWLCSQKHQTEQNGGGGRRGGQLSQGWLLDKRRKRMRYLMVHIYVRTWSDSKAVI